MKSQGKRRLRWTKAKNKNHDIKWETERKDRERETISDKETTGET